MHQRDGLRTPEVCPPPPPVSLPSPRLELTPSRSSPLPPLREPAGLCKQARGGGSSPHNPSIVFQGIIKGEGLQALVQFLNQILDKTRNMVLQADSGGFSVLSMKFVPENWSPFPLIRPWETMNILAKQVLCAERRVHPQHGEGFYTLKTYDVGKKCAEPRNPKSKTRNPKHESRSK